MKPNDKNAKYTILFIWIVLALEIVSFVSGYMQYAFLKAVQAGATITHEAAEANDNRETIIAVLYGIAFITSAVFFLRWFKTAYHNIRQKMPDMRYSEGWTIGAWFVPLLNLFRPYQIMREIYTQTRAFFINKDCEIGGTLTLRYFDFWWALWIISNVLAQSAPHASGQESMLVFATCMSMASNILGIPLALVTIKIIKDYARVEPVLQQIDDQPPPLPTPA